MSIDRFAELLLAYDCRSRSEVGLEPTDPAVDDPITEVCDDELRARLEGAKFCLRLLEQARLAGSAVGNEPKDIVQGRIGRFTLVRELGRGGHGIVWLAWDPAAQRHVALKTPHPELLFTTDDRQRFLREGVAAARLSHPHIVSVLEVDQSPPNFYIVSAYSEGKSLAAYLSEMSEPLPQWLAATWVAALADGVQHAHELGILHRDLKPANVVLEQPHRRQSAAHEQAPLDSHQQARQLIPKLTDFGVAKVIGTEELRTRTGVLLGTPNYMAPEQVDQSVGKVGPATDVYGLGAILYELLTGRPPFQSESQADLLRQVAAGDPTPPGQTCRSIPPDLEAICLHALQRRPQDRYPSAAELATDLRRFLGGETTRARPLGPVRRVIKWARRRPATAAGLCVGVVSTIVLAAGAIWHFVQVENALIVAEQARVRAETSERELRHLLYLRDMQSAHEALQRHDVRIASNLLKRQRDTLQPSNAGFLLRHLWAVCTGDPHVWQAHRGRAHSVEFTPDGKSLITAGSDGAVHVWDVETAARRFLLKGHTAEVNSARCSPDGKTIASCDDEGTVRFWRTDDGREVASFSPPGLTKISSLAWSPDGKSLAVGGTPGHAAALWDVDNQQIRAQLSGHSEEVNSVAWSPNGEMIAAASSDHTVCVWDNLGGLQAAIGPRLQHILCVTFTATGKGLAAAGMQDGKRGVVKVWDCATWQLAARHDTLADRVDVVAPTQDDELLTIGDNFGIVRQWNWRRDQVVRVVESQQGRVLSIANSPSASLCAAASADGSVSLWKNAQDTPASQWSTSGLGAAAAFTRDGRQLLAATVDHEALAYDLASRSTREIGRYPRDSSMLTLRVLPDESFLTTCALTTYHWQSITHTAPRLLRQTNPNTICIAVSHAGDQFITGNAVGEVLVWNTATGQLNSRLGTLAGAANCVACSSTDELAASASGGTTIHLWHLRSNHAPRVFDHGSEVILLAFAPDNRTLLSAGRDRQIRIWDLRSGKALPNVLQHLEQISSIAICPDEPILASGDSTGCIRLWSLATREELMLLGRLRGNAAFLEFSPDGCTLAAATDGDSASQETRFWRAPRLASAN